MSVIGIDLGTTNSLSCYFKNGGVFLIPQIPETQNYLLPSQIFVDQNGTFYVGNDIPENQNIHYNKDFFCSFKQFMGTAKQYLINGKTYTPVDFSAMVLKKIKENSELYLNEDVTEAIISVPAYFNDRQRSDTKKAAKIAGLKVERIINEPSAAALSYRLEENKGMENLLVFDFGGGTLDISLVECFENITEIVAIVGDNHLGGDNIDEAIGKAWAEKNGQVWESLDNDEMYNLKKEAEAFKRGQTSCIQLDDKEVFLACSSIFSKIKNLFNKILKDSDRELADIDELIMVGGSSKWPLVQQFMAELMKKAPVVTNQPDFTVAMGVGIYAAIRSRDQDIKDLVLTDVCPFTLGTGVCNNNTHTNGGVRTRLFPMIERNTTLPASVTESFVTVHDFQDKINISIYQGEEFDVKKDVLLGEVEIEVPIREAGQSGVLVTFNYDINGIIQVLVRNEEGEIKEFLLKNHEMSDEELAERLEKLKSLSQNGWDELDEELSGLIAQLEEIYSVEHGKERDFIARLCGDCSSVITSRRIIEKKKKIEETTKYLKIWRLKNDNLGNLKD